MKRFPLKKSFIACALALLAWESGANALEIQLESDTRLPLSYVNVLVAGGAVTDPEGRIGLTHFMGEMLMRGTRRHTKQEMDLLLDQWGAQLAVETRAESMIVRGAVLRDRLPQFLALLQEILSEPLFPEHEIAKLKSETLSGILAQQGSDHALASRKANQFLFQGHPYGRPIDGLPSQVSKFDRSALVRQHALLIRESQLTVLAVGDVPLALLEKWKTSLVAALPRQDGAAIPVTAAPRVSAKRRIQIIDKPDRTQTQILIGQIGALMTDSDYQALSLGNAAFGGGSFQSRLMQEIRVKRGWSYGARSAFRYGLQPRSWMVHLFPAEKDTPEALATTLTMIEELKSRGISEAEFQLARNSAIRGAAFLSDTPKKRIENRILEISLRLPPGFFDRTAELVAQVSRDQIQQALGRFLDPSQLSITIVGTASRLREPLARRLGIRPDEITVTPYTAE